jgi:hypothetical protein
MSKPHRCPHIAMTGNICVYDGYAETVLILGIVLEDQIPILSILHSLIPGMSLLRCEQYGHDMILTNKPVGV